MVTGKSIPTNCTGSMCIYSELNMMFISQAFLN